MLSQLSSNTKNYFKFIRRLKDYLELFSSKNIEKELTVEDIKRFLTLVKISQDHINPHLFESPNLKEQLSRVISSNKSLEANNSLTEYFYSVLNRPHNDFIFRSLMVNYFTLIKRGDPDSDLLDFLPSLNTSLKTVNPKLLLKSESLLTIFQEMTKSFSSFENYKGLDSNYVYNYLASFRHMGVDVTNEEFFKYHSNVLIEEKMNGMETQLDYFSAFDSFSFFIHDLQKLDFAKRMSTKKKFRAYFMFKMLEFFNFSRWRSLSDGAENKSNISDIREINPLPIRYDHITLLIKEFKHDREFIQTCELLLEKKLETEVCPVEILSDLGIFYLEHEMLNATVLHFLSYSAMEHLKSALTIYNFKKNILPLYDIIIAALVNKENTCSNSWQPADTLNAFFEEFKAAVFHNNFIESYSEDIFNFSSLSLETLQVIRKIHKRIPTLYFDASFDNFLEQAVNLNKNLTSINI